jgi:bifunctional enzyme CysN/CysC
MQPPKPTASSPSAETAGTHTTADAAAGSAGESVETDRLQAQLVWLGDEPLLPGRRYELRSGNSARAATVGRLIYRLSLETGASEPASHLEKNETGRCEILTEAPITCPMSPASGDFTLIDRLSNALLATGRMTAHESRRLFWEHGSVNKSVRAANKGQRPRVVWFTGLSGAGKSTLANALEEALFRDGRHTYLLDGDNIRHGISKDLGFGAEDRIENTRRVGEVAKLMADAGLIVLVSLISPFRAERRMVRDLLQPGEFIEVYVSTPLAVCEGRDRKGLYRLARAGTLKEFTGISSPYEPPEAPEIVIDTSGEELDACVRRIAAFLGETR